MKNKITQNIAFAILVVVLISASNFLSQGKINPVIGIIGLYIFALYQILSRLYKYLIQKTIIFERNIRYFDIAALLVIAIFFLQKREVTENNPILFGKTFFTLYGYAIISLGVLSMFRFYSFKKNGVRTSDSFSKTYYSDITSFELTDKSISYSTKQVKSIMLK